MERFDIPHMSCGHCIKRVTEAVLSVDPAAQIQADLAAQAVVVTSTADATRISAAIAAAGYANTLRV